MYAVQACWLGLIFQKMLKCSVKSLIELALSYSHPFFTYGHGKFCVCVRTLITCDIVIGFFGIGKMCFSPHLLLLFLHPSVNFLLEPKYTAVPESQPGIARISKRVLISSKKETCLCCSRLRKAILPWVLTRCFMPLCVLLSPGLPLFQLTGPVVLSHSQIVNDVPVLLWQCFPQVLHLGLSSCAFGDFLSRDILCTWVWWASAASNGASASGVAKANGHHWGASWFWGVCSSLQVRYGKTDCPPCLSLLSSADTFSDAWLLVEGRCNLKKKIKCYCCTQTSCDVLNLEDSWVLTHLTRPWKNSFCIAGLACLFIFHSWHFCMRALHCLAWIVRTDFSEAGWTGQTTCMCDGPEQGFSRRGLKCPNHTLACGIYALVLSVAGLVCMYHQGIPDTGDV